MRIVGGEWRGRRLLAPRGTATRPTADRVRQALFDMLMHPRWGGAETVSGARVVDGFAGTGALGLEALSRGAAHATFLERDPGALAVLQANIAAVGAALRSTVLAGDIRSCPPGRPAGLILLDPPYAQDLLPAAFGALRSRGWVADGALLIVEIGRGEPVPALGAPLAERVHGAARLVVWRVPPNSPQVCSPQV
jgi:16S rRNA (guanine966-N2)-methyltransferase